MARRSGRRKERLGPWNQFFGVKKNYASGEMYAGPGRFGKLNDPKPQVKRIDKMPGGRKIVIFDERRRELPRGKLGPDDRRSGDRRKRNIGPPVSEEMWGPTAGKRVERRGTGTVRDRRKK